MIYIEKEDLDPTRHNRKLKILYHRYLPAHDFSIYIDSNILIKCNLNLFVIKRIFKKRVTVVKHRERKTVEQEAKEVIRLKRDAEDVVSKQMNLYNNEGFTDVYLLTENGLILRPGSEKSIIKLMEMWWDQVRNHSKRDQLSFNYCRWKLNFDNVEIISKKEFFKNFDFTPHNFII